ncbi:MAG TPA: class I SAM-dependent methyltransferase [Deltaproteobacteria bacterium]|nr:class I SAM-dependent methyltransferase [Deltaproteobacteria bacterium]
MAVKTETDYHSITELPGAGASKEQIKRLYTRYRFAAPYCKSKDVLEVACGSGIGLGYLAQTARRVVGGDIDDRNLGIAKGIYADDPKVAVDKMDAHALPWSEASFDVVLLYEAIYYLDAERFVSEAFRVLRDGGVLIVCTVNRDWADFHPSPFSTRYFSVPELSAMLKEGGFGEVDFFGDSPVGDGGVSGSLLSLVKRAAVALNLIPRTLKGREVLKRLVFGRLEPMPAVIHDGMAPYEPPVSIPADRPCGAYKVFFVVARK